MKKLQLLFNLAIFLGIAIQSFTPAVSMENKEGELLQIQNSIRNTSVKIRNNLNLYKPEGSVIVLGSTGSGKSTLINILSGKPFIAQEGSMSYKVHTDDPLPGFNIGGGNVVGTKVPCSWFENESKTIFWDCPGFGDPRGPKEDILNIFSVNELFRPKTKVLLVVDVSTLIVDRATKFLDLLNEVTDLFSDTPEFKQSFSMVVSKKRNDQNVVSYLKNDVLTLNQNQQAKLTPVVRDLLEFIALNPQKISSFPYPEQLGEYAPNMQPVRECINSAIYMENPKPKIKVAGEALIYVEALGANLNNYISQYIKTEGHSVMKNYCNNLMMENEDSLEQLINRFQLFERGLRNLQAVIVPENPTLFPEKLKDIFSTLNVENISHTIEHIGFLKQIRNNITYNTPDWTNALFPTIRAIHKLTGKLENKKDMKDLKSNFLILKEQNSLIREENNQLKNQISLVQEENNKFFIVQNKFQEENNKLKIDLNSLASNSFVQEINKRLDILTQNTSQELKNQISIVQNRFQQENNNLTNNMLQEIKLSQKGCAKAWVVFNGSGNILDSYGVSSVIKNGTGNYTVKFSSPFKSSNYCYLLSARGMNESLGAVCDYVPQTENSFRMVTHFFNNGTHMDASLVSACFYGN